MKYLDTGVYARMKGTTLAVNVLLKVSNQFLTL